LLTPTRASSVSSASTASPSPTRTPCRPTHDNTSDRTTPVLRPAATPSTSSASRAGSAPRTPHLPTSSSRSRSTRAARCTRCAARSSVHFAMRRLRTVLHRRAGCWGLGWSRPRRGIRGEVCL
jgi:hypothetical protein